MHDPGLRGHSRAVANLQMSGNSNLPGQDHATSEFSAARNANMRYDNAALPDHHIMGDLDKVIDDGARADYRIRPGTTVDASVRANFNAIFNQDPPKLRDTEMTGRAHRIAEAVLPDPDTGQQSYPVSDNGMRDRAAIWHPAPISTPLSMTVFAPIEQ